MNTVLLSTLCFGAALVLQPMARLDPVAHMLLQYPVLGASGYLLGLKMPTAPDLRGPLLVLGITCVGFWMLPRSLDAALDSPGMHLAKLVTLPLLAGLPLGMSVPRVGAVLRGFLKAQSLSMLGVLSFLYSHAPIRICNSYLIEDQQRLGAGFLWLAGGLSLLWAVPLFLGHSLVPDLLLQRKKHHDLC